METDEVWKEEFISNYNENESELIHENKISFSQLSILTKFGFLELTKVKDIGNCLRLKKEYSNLIYGLNKYEIKKHLKEELDDLIRALQIYLMYYMPGDIIYVYNQEDCEQKVIKAREWIIVM